MGIPLVVWVVWAAIVVTFIFEIRRRIRHGNNPSKSVSGR